MRSTRRIKGLFLTPLACVLLLGNFPVHATEIDSAQILSLEGTVTLKQDKENDWKAAQPGTEVGLGGQILTHANSTCQVGIGGNIVKLSPNSGALISSLDPAKIELQSGKIFTLVRSLNPGSTFAVRTPVAVATARGTAWSQDLQSIEAFENVVHIESASGDVMDLNQGQGIAFDSDGTFGEPYTLSDEVKEEFSQFIEAAALPAPETPDLRPDDADDFDFDALSGTESLLDDTTHVMTEAQTQADESANDQSTLDKELSPDTKSETRQD